MQKHKYKRVTTILTAGGLFLLGLALGQAHWQASVVVAVVSLIGLVALRGRRFGIIFLACFALTLGLWRGGQAAKGVSELEQRIGQRLVLSGQIADDPTITSRQTSFTLGDLQLGQHRLAGQIAVTSYRVDVRRGTRIQLTGVLKPGFGSKVASMGYGKLVVTSDKLDWLERLRQGFFAGMHTALPDPLASLALGLLIGARALIPRWLQVQLANVGLSHLVAVSGYNLTIVAGALYRIIRPRSRNIATVSSLWVIGGFVLVAGASASVIRAALVAVLTLFASLRGRSFEPLILVVLAAALTAGYNPSVITGDLSWQLSFLAFIGIAVLAPYIAARFIKDPNPLQMLFIEASAAQLLTWPLIAFVFHQFSAVALVANILIMPLVPFTMAASFIAGLTGSLVPLVAGWLSWPAVLVLRWMLAAVGWMSALSGSVVPVTLSAFGLLWAYGIMAAVVVSLRRGRLRTKTSS